MLVGKRDRWHDAGRLNILMTTLVTDEELLPSWVAIVSGVSSCD
jgi:hypothetical protein